jgi:hypothetical protein
MTTSRPGSEHLLTSATLLELTAQLELLARNAAIETSAHSNQISSDDIVDNEMLCLTPLDTLLQDVRETLHRVHTTDTQDPATSEALCRLARRLTQTVFDLESP